MDNAASKVLILYVLDKINEEISESGLFKIISSINTDINYFYFKQILNDVVNSNLAKENADKILITSQGLESLLLTENVIPGILKLKADSILKGELSLIEEESSVIAEFAPKGENGYTVSCKIVESGETIFEVQIYATSQERANAIVENWKKNASTIYPNMLNLLIDN